MTSRTACAVQPTRGAIWPLRSPSAHALKEVQAAIDALPLSHRELMAAHGTQVYRQGKGFFRVVHPVVARSKHRAAHGSYVHELREAHVFNHRMLDVAGVVTHELGHAVHDALGHLRAGVGETAQATNTHAPSQQPDFMCIYQQHRTNPKLSPCCTAPMVRPYPMRGLRICAHSESAEQCWATMPPWTMAASLTYLVFNTVQVYRRQGVRHAFGHERRTSLCGIIAVTMSRCVAKPA
jgi:hypothetical protein